MSGLPAADRGADFENHDPPPVQVSRLSTVLHRHRWWAARIVALPFHMFLFAIGVFLLVRLIPGNPIYVMTGGHGISHATYEKAAASLGLNGSLLEQLRTYLGNLIRLRLGTSIINGTAVSHDLAGRLPETLQLAVLAMIFASILTLALGFLIVLRPRNLFAVIAAPYARAAGALPDFCLGVGGIFVFYSLLHWVPAPLGLISPVMSEPGNVTGFPLLDAALQGDWAVLGSMAAHLLLPVAVLTFAYAPILLKIFIRGLEEAIDAPATRFRIASGTSRTMVLLSVTRRALPAAVAMFGTLFGFLIGGAVVVEQLFALPGMGTYAVDAVNSTDFIALQGFLLVTAAISLVVFLLVDIATMMLDPRRRPGAVAGGAR
jgi:peptide/nickel transport system permease protein